MKSKTVQWMVCAITMGLFTWLTLSGRFTWLAIAIIASSLVWYMAVPRANYG